MALVAGCQGQGEVAVGGESGAPAVFAAPTGGATFAEAGPGAKARVVASYAKLPLSFEPNRGQTDARVEFLSRGRGTTLFLTATEVVLVLRRADPPAFPPALAARLPKSSGGQVRRAGAVRRAGGGPSAVSRDPGAGPEAAADITGTALRMRLVGANPEPEITGLERLPGKSNYFIGNDPEKWRTNIPHYAKVKYQGVYPGIDLVFYGIQRQLEYDFIVAAGADPGVITLAFEGADELEIDAQGNLVVEVRGGRLIHHAPVLSQQGNDAKEPVRGRYVLKGEHEVGFEVAAYDASKPLLIDPVLSYSTYLGSSDNENEFGGGAIAVDAAGNAYVMGYTSSTDFPTANPLQPDFAGGLRDAFVTKLNADGSALVYSTYLGGSGTDRGRGIAVDAAGNATVTGSTLSTDFPATTGAFQASCVLDSLGFCSDAFISKLNADGSALVYSTYLGGSRCDCGYGIAVDAGGNAYVTGNTRSTDFPMANPLQPANAGLTDAFMAKITPANPPLCVSFTGFADGLEVFVSSGIVYGTWQNFDGAGSNHPGGGTVGFGDAVFEAELPTFPDQPFIFDFDVGARTYDLFMTDGLTLAQIRDDAAFTISQGVCPFAPGQGGVSTIDSLLATE